MTGDEIPDSAYPSLQRAQGGGPLAEITLSIVYELGNDSFGALLHPDLDSRVAWAGWRSHPPPRFFDPGWSYRTTTGLNGGPLLQCFATQPANVDKGANESLWQ